MIPSTADINGRDGYVRFVPTADIGREQMR
jgi:hypothetical protein